MFYDNAVKKTRECSADWDEKPLSEAEAPGLTEVRSLRVAKSFDVGIISFGVVRALDARAGAPFNMVSIVASLAQGSPLAL